MRPVLPLSNLPGIVWPTIPGASGVYQLALLYQLEQSEKWSPEQLIEVQYRQLSELLLHAWNTCQFYRASLKAAGYTPGSIVTPEWFSGFPLLTRTDLQDKFPSIKSSLPPPKHGPVGEGKSSGSTGRPIEYLSTEHTRTLWRTSVLREHLWNRRDFNARVAIIRAKVKDGLSPNWGDGIAAVFPSSACQVINSINPLDKLANWLLQQAPEYLLVFPSTLRGLTEEFKRLGKPPPQMRQIVTQGEMLTPELRIQCESFFNAPIRDIYSASEVGYIAVQCEAGHYHVQEQLLVEILDEAGKPVAPGQWGKVVVTTLHNFALPLIRYAIGDYAEAGDVGCECGRNLRKINRLMGRTRNLVTLPDGRRFWPLMASNEWPESAGITRFQVVQKRLDTLEVRLELPRPLTNEERSQITAALHNRLGYPFLVTFTEMREMPIPENGKFEDFLSEIAA